MNIKGITFEFFRYLLVGGSAFIIDAGTLYLVQTYLLYSWGAVGILVSTAIGFIVGLIYNYILSNLFVFKKIDDKVKKHPIRSFTIFSIIGIIGLLLTEIGMYAGIILIGQKYYMFIKVVVAAIVLLWNYIARKVFIFKGEELWMKTA
jgi:putative flippase GtrA